MSPRYALYFVPAPDSALYRFGASVLGYDAFAGENVPTIKGAERSAWPDIVREPRVYGFHATLKAPFHLADGFDETMLLRAVHDFGAAYMSVPVGVLAVRELGRFIALTPQTPCKPLDDLAAACVREFDMLRAPLTAKDRERRLAAGVTERQTRYLDRWGYPYVFEEFRFHMTLTGPLDEPQRSEVFAFLRDRFEQLGAALLTVDRLVIAVQPGPSQPFRIAAQTMLTGSSAGGS